MGVQNIKTNGFTLSLLGEDYNFRLTMFANEFLAGKYGSTKKAYEKLAELSVCFQPGPPLEPGGLPTDPAGMPADGYDTILSFIYAGIIHNQYDRKGEIVREIPTVFSMKSAMSEADFRPLATAIILAQHQALPDPVPSGEDENPL